MSTNSTTQTARRLSPHDRWIEEQWANDMRLRIGGPPASPKAPDAESADRDACLLWIRRQGWMGRVEEWMIEWVREGRAS